MQLTDEDIAAMTPADRRDLIRRLAPNPAGFPTRRTIDRLRKWRTVLMLVCAAAMIPWTVYLAITLPNHYVARNWVATWVGFDILLVAMLVLTALAGWKRKQFVFPTAFATGVLLVCDAWFDVLLDAGTSDVWLSVASAVIVELPLAFLMFNAARRLIRLSAVVAVGGAGSSSDCDDIPEDALPPLWKIPLFGVGNRTGG